MRRMTWRDFIFLGGGLAVVGMLATMYPDGDGMRLRDRLLFGVSFAAFIMAVILFASAL
jgi:hypothetical protein